MRGDAPVRTTEVSPAVNSEPTLITSVQRALRLLEAVGENAGGAQAKVLARQVDLPLATTYHLLRTLVHDGYVRKLPHGAFVLGDGIEALARRDNPQVPLRRARPTMATLRDNLSAATYLSLYRDGEIEVMQIVDGPRAPRADVPVGPSGSAHASALGKCVLRQLSEEQLADYLSRHAMNDFTPKTLTRHSSLRRHLASAIGPITVDEDEYVLGMTCAAVPVSDGEHVGSLAISMRTERVRDIRRLTPTLVSTAATVSNALSLSI
jgi:DNA-binding IclR family transcriptional regulator